jgi:hypothetical protein
VKYELGFYIPEDGILHSHRRENLKSYIVILKIFQRDIERKKNLNAGQFAFRASHIRTLQLTMTTNQLALSFNNIMSTAVVLLDIAET